ncbi:MAG: caspase family protein [Spirulina sp.]
MGLDRRTFLQGAGLAFLAAGMGAGGGDRLTPLGIASHFQALAGAKGRKLALLVGIDRYGNQTLQGCKTDVELQQELLIHRFGFSPRDILVLTDEKGTRENIETAFSEEFLPEAKAGDVVVFHFSGYGSQISLPLPSTERENNKSSASGIKVEEKIETALANGLLTAGGKIGEAGILEATLLEWARSLSTPNLTMVLDTSYAPPEKSLQGNSRSISLPGTRSSFLPQKWQPTGKASDLAIAQNSTIPGILLQAAREGETAIEVVGNGFSAGLFTYTLVQTLWQATAPTTIQTVFSRSAAQMQGMSAQRPQKLGKRAADPSASAYLTQPESSLGAEGVITKVESDGSTVSLHLAGLPMTVLQNYGTNSQLMAGEPETAIALKVISRSGLTVKAERLEKNDSNAPPLSPGQLVRESLRVLPHNIGLIVALDAQLSRIERVDATSAFANVSTVSSVVVAGEQSADCLFSRGDSSLAVVTETLDSDPSSPQGYGLFSTGYVSLPNTLEKGDEAIKAAVERLTPKFKTLLAVKLWQAIVNEASSQLAVRASLQAVDPQLSPKLERTTRGFESKKPSNNRFDETLVTFSAGQSVRFELENAGDCPLYLMLVGVKTTGSPVVLYSAPDPDADELQFRELAIEPGNTLQLTKSTSTLNGFTAMPPGIEETIVICSRSPFEKVLELLATLSTPHGKGDLLIELSQPLEVARALLQDLNDASGVSSSTDHYALDVKTWAALRFVYQIA